MSALHDIWSTMAGAFLKSFQTFIDYRVETLCEMGFFFTFAGGDVLAEVCVTVPLGCGGQGRR